ncbi:MAG: aa3-type cytochrome c oxidase subunit IV [Pseudomonadota bacterium]
MSAHKHGEMDIREQSRTFNSFLVWMVRGGVATLLILIFLALFNS